MRTAGQRQAQSSACSLSHTVCCSRHLGCGDSRRRRALSLRYALGARVRRLRRATCCGLWAPHCFARCFSSAQRAHGSGHMTACGLPASLHSAGCSIPALGVVSAAFYSVAPISSLVMSDVSHVCHNLTRDSTLESGESLTTHHTHTTQEHCLLCQ